MINQKYTRVFNTEHRPVETGALIADEGMALVFAKQGDSTVVRPSTGASGEIFAGVSMARNTPPLFMPFVFEGVVPADGVLELPRTPIADQILVRVAGTSIEVAAGDTVPTDATKVNLDDNEVRFHASQRGAEVFVQIMYEPTVTEARQVKGDVPVGGLSTIAQSVTGVITKGDVATTYFDASADFSSAIQVRLGADGIFTTTGSGTLIPGVTVQQAPSAASPVLVLNIK